MLPAIKSATTTTIPLQRKKATEISLSCCREIFSQSRSVGLQKILQTEIEAVHYYYVFEYNANENVLWPLKEQLPFIAIQFSDDLSTRFQ